MQRDIWRTTSVMHYGFAASGGPKLPENLFDMQHAKSGSATALVKFHPSHIAPQPNITASFDLNKFTYVLLEVYRTRDCCDTAWCCWVNPPVRRKRIATGFLVPLLATHI